MAVYLTLAFITLVSNAAPGASGWATMAVAFVQQFRFAAAESVPPKLVGTAISWVVAGGMGPRAVQLFEQALALEPGNRQARIGLGKAAFQQGDFAEAVRRLEPIYRSRGNMDLGVAYVRVGRIADAKRQFELILERDPDDADARRALDAVNR